MLVVLGPWAARGRRGDPVPKRRSAAGRGRVFAETGGELEERVEQVLRRWPVDRPRISRHLDLLLVDALPTPAMLAVLAAAMRGEGWACGVFLRPPCDPRLAATRVIEDARRSPWGVAVRRDPADRASVTVNAALAPHVTLLRQRSAAVWAALDAVAVHRTATAAARELDCSQQTVSRHLARANCAAVAQTRLVVEALLAAR